MSKVAVIGLSGESIFMKVTQLPYPSVTVHANEVYVEPGGKGYNQAVALAKMGIEVSFLTKVGKDSSGEYCRAYMEEIGIQCFAIEDEKEKTALATILTDEQGENEVIVYPGASQCLTVEDVRAFQTEIQIADVLVLQYEIPKVALQEAIHLAKQSHTYIILNPAPAIYDDNSLLQSVDLITPNLEEAKKLYHLNENSTLDEVVGSIKCQPHSSVIVTLGKKGALLIEENQETYFSGIVVDAVDTTGAGDTFTAGLAASIARGKKIEEAISYAMVAASLSVTKPHVLESLPTNAEIEKFTKLYNLKK
ncbi:MAG: ribokinase [Prevotella sp.]|nr:ribokinase [Staphylococcus sp.]MCM1349984.1 ribokinase [Prevotella sp.]